MIRIQAGEATMAFAKAHEQIASALSGVEGVESVYVGDNADLLCVSTVVNEATDEICGAVYNVERQLIRNFSPKRFDFNIVERQGRNPSHIFGDIAPVWQRHDSCQIEGLI